MSIFRRERVRPTMPPSEVDGPDPSDHPDALASLLFGVVRLINQSSGRLPGEAVVNARRVTDTLRAIISTSDVRPLDVYAVIHVKSTLTDYLPNTIRTYLAVDEHLRDDPRPAGLTATQSLLEQIDALQTSADLALTAAQKLDIDALVTQGTFLRTKFARSDLDL